MSYPRVFKNEFWILELHSCQSVNIWERREDREGTEYWALVNPDRWPVVLGALLGEILGGTLTEIPSPTSLPLQEPLL